MNISMAFQNLNWLAVFIAAISTFIIGGLWYSSLLFQKEWMIANNLTLEGMRSGNPPKTFGISFILALIMAINLALFVGQKGFLFGIMAGFLTGFGWVSMGLGIIALFEMRSLKWVLINGGYMIVAFIVMGAILGAWK